MAKQVFYLNENKNLQRQMKSMDMARRSMGNGSFDRFSNWTLSSLGSIYFSSKRKITSYKDFNFLPVTKTQDLDVELLFAVMRIINDKPNIESFLISSQKIESLILQRKYQEALSHLDIIDEEFGYSLWTLDLKLSLTFLLNGSGALEELQREIAKLGKGGLIPSYSYNQRIKLEYQANPQHIRENLRNRLLRADLSREFTDYIVYRLAAYYPENMDDIAHILFNENRASSIDVFVTLRDLISFYGDDLHKQVNDILQKLDQHKIIEELNKLIMSPILWEHNEIPIAVEELLSMFWGYPGNQSSIEEVDLNIMRFPRSRITSFMVMMREFMADANKTGHKNADALLRMEIGGRFISSLSKAIPHNEELSKLNSLMPELINTSFDVNIIKVSDFNSSSTGLKYLLLNRIDKGESETVFRDISTASLIDHVDPKRLPINYAISKMRDDYKNRQFGSMCSLIVAHMHYSTYGGKDSYQLVQEELDCFLSKQQVDFPSEIDLRPYPEEISAYYLSEVCKQNIIDYWYMLGDSKELAEERIRCLQHLKKIKKLSGKEIDEEIIDISAVIGAISADQTIERTKLKVDVGRLEGALNPKIGLEFKRLLSIYDPNYSREKTNLIYNAIRDRKLADEFNEGEEDSAYFLANQIMNSIAREFLDNSEFGLEQVMGTTIRHNIILDEVASSFNKNNLYVKRGDLTIDMILSRWASVVDLPPEQLTQKLTTFTSDINRIVNEFKEKYIHVHSHKHKHGVIDLEVTKQATVSALAVLDKQTSLGNFIKYAINILNNFLRLKTKQMRLIVDRELRRDLINKFSRLELYLVQYSTDHDRFAEVFQSCRIGLDESIDKIKKWFTVESISEGSQQFRPSETLQSAVSTLKSIDRPNMEMIEDIDDTIEYSQHTHITLTYCLLNLIDNEIRYGELGKLKISIRSESNILHVILESKLIDENKRSLLRTKWNDVSTAAALEQLDLILCKESGTGIARVFSQLRSIKDSDFLMTLNEDTLVFKISCDISPDSNLVRIIEEAI